MSKAKFKIIKPDVHCEYLDIYEGEDEEITSSPICTCFGRFSRTRKTATSAKEDAELIAAALNAYQEKK